MSDPRPEGWAPVTFLRRRLGLDRAGPAVVTKILTDDGDDILADRQLRPLVDSAAANQRAMKSRFSVSHLLVIGAGLGTAALILLVGSCAHRPRPNPPMPDLGTFTLQCDPFGGLAEHQPIDDHCGPDGVGGQNSIAQNRVKNNFCAQGPATIVIVGTLQTLQADVPALGIAFGTPQTIPTPADRPKLQHADTTHGISIGEGSLVQMVGFIVEAHYSDVGNGEDVNWNIPGEPTNDIHIAIGQALDAPECTSITAEIIPHFRPHAWTGLATLNGLNVVTLRQRARLDRPLRFTGQLMFDASHLPCANGQPARNAPARTSSWEVHPVYRIDVCRETSLDACSASNDAIWTPLDQWRPVPTSP